MVFTLATVISRLTTALLLKLPPGFGPHTVTLLLICMILFATQVVVLSVKKCIMLVILLGYVTCPRGTRLLAVVCIPLESPVATLALINLGVIVPICMLWGVSLCVIVPARLTMFVPEVVQPVRFVPFTRFIIESTPTM